MSQLADFFAVFAGLDSGDQQLAAAEIVRIVSAPRLESSLEQSGFAEQLGVRASKIRKCS
jgi:hypothetical protein